MFKTNKKKCFLKLFDDNEDYNKDYVNSSDSRIQTFKETLNLNSFDDYT